MVLDEISFFEPNPSLNSHGLNRSFFSLDQKTTHPIAKPYIPPQIPTYRRKSPTSALSHQKTAPENNVSGAASILYFTIYLAFDASKKA